MREVFEVSELVRIAVEDERTGVAFYSRAAEKAQDSGLKSLFADLAGQEKYHQQRFQQMLDNLGGSAPKEQYPGEYMAYLTTLTSERAFPDEETALSLTDQCEDDEEIIQLASRFERDTLMLMNEMSRLVGKKDKEVVDEIIREEQKHLVTLAEAMKEL